MCLKCKGGLVFNDNLTACQAPKNGQVTIVCSENEDPRLVNIYM